jgi:NADH-quinone oxidoreductase subunit C
VLIMANKDDIITKISAMLPANAVCRDDAYRSGVVFSATAPLEKVRDVLGSFKEGGFFLESVTALDFQDTGELVYHLNTYEPKARMVVRVLVGDGATVPTVSDLFPTADWQEREIREFFGIQFAGHPDPRNLLLPEDADYYPLKKTFGSVNAYRRREEIYG